MLHIMTAAAAAAKAPTPKAPAALIVLQAPPVNMGIEEEELLDAPGDIEAEAEALLPMLPMPPMALTPLLMELMPLLMELMLLLVPVAMPFDPI